MVFDFVYTKELVLKKDLLPFLIDKMKSVGWEDLSENKNSVDGYTMFSKGESGTDNIGINILPYYYQVARNIMTTVYGYISVRPFNTYIPSPSLTSKGKYQPNDTFNETRLLNNTNLEKTISVYYHVNKDRMIAVIQDEDINTLSASFIVLGKPHMIGDCDEYSVSSAITSHGDFDGKAPIKQNGYLISNYPYTYRTMTQNGSNRYNNFASTITLSNELVGEHIVVENIFTMDYYGMNMVSVMNNETFTDENGRVFKQFVNNMTSGLRTSDFRRFIIRIG